jgi:hypothetical protein
MNCRQVTFSRLSRKLYVYSIISFSVILLFNECFAQPPDIVVGHENTGDPTGGEIDNEGTLTSGGGNSDLVVISDSRDTYDIPIFIYINVIPYSLNVFKDGLQSLRCVIHTASVLQGGLLQ